MKQIITVLKQVPELFDAELRGKTGKTHNRGYRATLHGEEDVIRKLIEKVSLQKP